MMRKPPTGLFVAGTNTGVGKTFYAAALARTLTRNGTRVGVYKPVMSGCRMELDAAPKAPTPEELQQADDDVQLWWAAGCPGGLARVSPQRFRDPLAPHLAALAEGRSVDPQLLRSGLNPWLESSDLVLVEGAGGLFSPITEMELNADLAADFGFPIVLVAANTLGVIHATLATLLAARQYRGGLEVAAVVLNDLPDGRADLSRGSNFAELERRCRPTPVLVHAANATQAEAGWLERGR